MYLFKSVFIMNNSKKINFNLYYHFLKYLNFVISNRNFNYRMSNFKASVFLITFSINARFIDLISVLVGNFAIR